MMLKESDREAQEDVATCISSQLMLDYFMDARRKIEKAAAYTLAGASEKAEKQALDALRISRSLAREHFGPNLAKAALNYLVTSYIAQGRFESAEPYARELVDRTRSAIGMLHPASLAPLNSLASILNSLARFREAADVLLEVQMISSSVYGEQHPHTELATQNAKRAEAMAAEGFDAADSRVSERSESHLAASTPQHKSWLERFCEGSLPQA